MSTGKLILNPWLTRASSQGRGGRRAVRCKRLFGGCESFGDFGPDPLLNQNLQTEHEGKQGDRVLRVSGGLGWRRDCYSWADGVRGRERGDAYVDEVGREDDVSGCDGGCDGADVLAEGVLCELGVVLVELGETCREDCQVVSVES